MSEHVVLRIAATTGHVGLARATATAMAARLDFTYDRLTDLHIAIDEVCGRVLATSDPPARRLELTFEPGGTDLRVTVRGDGKLKPETQFLNPWSKVILESIVADLDVLQDDDGGVTVLFRIDRGE